MKKIVFTLAMMLGLSLCVKAQDSNKYWVGGSV